jgi:hypothetical protein
MYLRLQDRLPTSLATANNRSGPVHTGPVRLCPKYEHVRTSCGPGPRPLRAKNQTGPDLTSLGPCHSGQPH